jgi:hypothetical protein
MRDRCALLLTLRILLASDPSPCEQVYAPSMPLMWLPQKPYLVMGTLRDQVRDFQQVA